MMTRGGARPARNVARRYSGVSISTAMRSKSSNVKWPSLSCSSRRRGKGPAGSSDTTPHTHSSHSAPQDPVQMTCPLRRSKPSFKQNLLDRLTPPHRPSGGGGHHRVQPPEVLLHHVVLRPEAHPLQAPPQLLPRQSPVRILVRRRGGSPRPSTVAPSWVVAVQGGPGRGQASSLASSSPTTPQAPITPGETHVIDSHAPCTQQLPRRRQKQPTVGLGPGGKFRLTVPGGPQPEETKTARCGHHRRT